MYIFSAQEGHPKGADPVAWPRSTTGPSQHHEKQCPARPESLCVTCPSRSGNVNLSESDKSPQGSPEPSPKQESTAALHLASRGRRCRDPELPHSGPEEPTADRSLLLPEMASSPEPPGEFSPTSGATLEGHSGQEGQGQTKWGHCGPSGQTLYWLWRCGGMGDGRVSSTSPKCH